MNDLAGKVSIREDLIRELKDGTCTVIFNKADGSERTIRGTLRDEVLEDYESLNKRSENLEVVPLYDIDEDHWKSFRLDSVKSFESNSTVYYAVDGTDSSFPIHPTKNTVCFAI